MLPCRRRTCGTWPLSRSTSSKLKFFNIFINDDSFFLYKNFLFLQRSRRGGRLGRAYIPGHETGPGWLASGESGGDGQTEKQLRALRSGFHGHGGFFRVAHRNQQSSRHEQLDERYYEACSQSYGGYNQGYGYIFPIILIKYWKKILYQITKIDFLVKWWSTTVKTPAPIPANSSLFTSKKCLPVKLTWVADCRFMVPASFLARNEPRKLPSTPIWLRCVLLFSKKKNQKKPALIGIFFLQFLLIFKLSKQYWKKNKLFKICKSVWFLCYILCKVFLDLKHADFPRKK